MFRFRLLLICLSMLFTACSGLTPSKIVNPSQLTIDDAMASIGRGFFKMHQELGGYDTRTPATNSQKQDSRTPEQIHAERVKLGLWPCKVTTTLNLAASATQSKDLVLDLSGKPPVQVVDASFAARAEQKNDSSGKRDNSITIEMYSAACLPDKTLGYDKPEKVKGVVEALDEGQKKSYYMEPP